MGLFKKKEKESKACCCGNIDDLIAKEDDNTNTCNCDTECNSTKMDCNIIEQNNTELVIKILGSGCKNCITLTENVNKALEEIKLEARVIKVTDFAEITGYGIMSTPALVINEKVVSYGKVLKPSEVVKILEKVAK